MARLAHIRPLDRAEGTRQPWRWGGVGWGGVGTKVLFCVILKKWPSLGMGAFVRAGILVLSRHCPGSAGAEN